MRLLRSSQRAAQVTIAGLARPRGLSATATSAKACSSQRMPVAELISVIVTTYNREDALDAVLRSLARPDRPGFRGRRGRRRFGRCDRPHDRRLEGAGSAIASMHVWHEDRGFRAAEIRNRAILAARGAYCIFLDGDCIVRPDFVATHRRLGRARLVRHRQPHSAVARAHRQSAAREARRRKPGICVDWVARTLARRHQPSVGASAPAARAAAPAARARLAGRALLQSRDLARRP